MVSLFMKCAVVGGTGKLGFGLALRLARAGYPVIIGSRHKAKAIEAAQRVQGSVGGDVRGSSIEGAAEAGSVVFLTVPFTAHADTVKLLKPYVDGKIVVDTTVPLVPPRVSRFSYPKQGSVARQARASFGPGVKLVSAFQNVAAAHLAEIHKSVSCDVLVTGDDPDARAKVIELAEAVGLRAWHAGPIDNAVAAEALTSVLIFINRYYGKEGSGVQIVVDQGSAETRVHAALGAKV